MKFISKYFSIASHFAVTEYVYIILDKGLVFIFANMACQYLK